MAVDPELLELWKEASVKKSAYRHWTRKEENELSELHASKLSYAEIGKRLNRTVKAIRSRCESKSLRRNHTRTEWLEVFSGKESSATIAGRLGVHIGSVKRARRVLRRDGLLT